MNKIHINNVNYKYKKECDDIIGLLPFIDADHGYKTLTLQELESWVNDSYSKNKYYFTPCENLEYILNRYNYTNTVGNTNISNIELHELLKKYEEKILVITDGSAYTYRIDIFRNSISLNVSNKNKLKNFKYNNNCYDIEEIFKQSEFIPLIYRENINLDDIVNKLKNKSEDLNLITEFINSPFECLRKLAYISFLKECRNNIITKIKNNDIEENKTSVILNRLNYIDKEIVKNMFESEELLKERSEVYSIG